MGVSASDGLPLYKFPGTDESEGCEACFTRMNGKIVLWNRSMDENAVVSLSVPKVGALQPQTIVIPQNGTLEMDQIFEDCANYDSTKLMVSAMNSTPAVRQGLAAASDLFHICAAASDVPADGNTAVRLGSYLTVVCSPDKAVFTGANRSIHQITAVHFQGRNDQKLRLLDIPATPTDSGTVVEVVFPSPFPDGTVLDIDAEADIGGLADVLKAQTAWCRISYPNAEEIRQLNSKPIIR